MENNDCRRNDRDTGNDSFGEPFRDDLQAFLRQQPDSSLSLSTRSQPLSPFLQQIVNGGGGAVELVDHVVRPRGEERAPNVHTERAEFAKLCESLDKDIADDLRDRCTAFELAAEAAGGSDADRAFFYSRLNV